MLAIQAHKQVEGPNMEKMLTRNIAGIFYNDLLRIGLGC